MLHPLPTQRQAYIRDDLVTLYGQFDILRATDQFAFQSVLDIGFGRGGASVYFASLGKTVKALSLTEVGVDYPKDIFDQGYPEELMDELGIIRDGTDFHHLPEGEERYDAIWMSHVLEHTSNGGDFLRKAHRLLTDEGWLFVCVPPFKHQVTIGHVSIGWNLGILIHVLLVNGFNVRDGHFLRHGYNVCGFVQKGNDLEPLIARGASFDELSVTAFNKPWCDEVWPFPAFNGFEGELDQVNWHWPEGYTPHIAPAMNDIFTIHGQRFDTSRMTRRREAVQGGRRMTLLEGPHNMFAVHCQLYPPAPIPQLEGCGALNARGDQMLQLIPVDHAQQILQSGF